MFNLKLNFTNIKKSITNIVSKVFNRPVEQSIPDIESIVKDRFREYLLNTSFFRSASDGNLKGQLGFPDGESYDIVSNFIDDVIDQIIVEYYPYTNKAGGRIIVTLKEDYITELSSSSILVSENGYDLPWIEWLLTAGSKPIITDFRYKPMLGKGRSLEGIMINKGSWHVPNEFAGTEQSNIITRYLEDFQQNIEQTISNIINKNLNV